MMGEIKTHELARQLLKLPDIPVGISIDVSTCEEDSDLRAFAGEYFGVNDITGHTGEIVLLFGGNLNYKVCIKK